MSTEATAAVGNPDEWADFQAFYEDYFPSMLARAYVISGHRQDAEDAVQEAYMEALQRWQRVRRYDSPDAYVYRIVRQRLWRAVRLRGRVRLRPSALELPRPPVASAEQTALARTVLEVLAALPRRQRQVIVMHRLNGMKQDEIANELGITRSAVAGNIRKALGNLRKALGLGRRAGEDALVPRVPRILLPVDGLAEDSLAGVLRETETWLRASIEADPRTAQQIYTRVIARAAGDDAT